ncbi:MAG TPA: glycosyltransferase, partial [Azonexus sp.]|nr:glycosyltransferase [Azonexus sp.]
MKPLVSVVIPTYRRPDMLRRCLESVLGQHPAPEAYEVIVVDDGRSDDTRRQLAAIARDMARRGNNCELRYLCPPPGQGG